MTKNNVFEKKNSSPSENSRKFTAFNPTQSEKRQITKHCFSRMSAKKSINNEALMCILLLQK